MPRFNPVMVATSPVLRTTLPLASNSTALRGLHLLVRRLCSSPDPRANAFDWRSWTTNRVVRRSATAVKDEKLVQQAYSAADRQARIRTGVPSVARRTRARAPNKVAADAARPDVDQARNSVAEVTKLGLTDSQTQM